MPDFLLYWMEAVGFAALILLAMKMIELATS